MLLQISIFFFAYEPSISTISFYLLKNSKSKFTLFDDYEKNLGIIYFCYFLHIYVSVYLIS